jgi:hypothetical protein
MHGPASTTAACCCPRPGEGLTAEQFTELQGYRDDATAAWEKSISATVVHYINDTLQDMNTFGTEDYNFYDHAKHWGEMKGFALALQFNRRSPLMDSEDVMMTKFYDMQMLMGTAPVLPTASTDDQAAYRADLIEARTLIGLAYGFDAANLGDDNGENGW